MSLGRVRQLLRPVTEIGARGRPQCFSTSPEYASSSSKYASYEVVSPRRSTQTVKTSNLGVRLPHPLYSASAPASGPLTLTDLVNALAQRTKVKTEEAARARDAPPPIGGSWGGAGDAHVQGLLSRTRFSAADWAMYALFNPGRAYTRNVIAAHENFTVLCLCWLPGIDSVIHNHPGAGCWVKVMDGEIQETIYREVTPDSTGRPSATTTSCTTNSTTTSTRTCASLVNPNPVAATASLPAINSVTSSASAAPSAEGGEARRVNRGGVVRASVGCGVGGGSSCSGGGGGVSGSGTLPRLVKTRDLYYGAGDVTYIDDSLGYHKVGNPSNVKPAVTMHIYAPAYHSCSTWQDTCSQPVEAKVAFDNVVLWSANNNNRHHVK